MSTRIPKVFHFVYGLRPQNRPFHLVHYLCLESCIRVNRPDRVFFHYRHPPWGEYWDLVRDKVTPVRARRPNVRLDYSDPRIEAYRYAHESDFVRLDVLLKHGGVYADIDTIFVNPYPDALFDHPFVLGKENDVGVGSRGGARPSLCNALIMSEPEADFCRLWRERIEDAFDGSWSRHSTLLPCELAQAASALIHVEPPETFYRYMWTPEDLHRLLEACEDVGSSMCSIHLWAHLWWSERRTDFSNVHERMINERRIRRLDTTYNLLARPFLPPPGRRRSLRAQFTDTGPCLLGILHEGLRRAGRAWRWYGKRNTRHG